MVRHVPLLLLVLCATAPAVAQTDDASALFAEPLPLPTVITEEALDTLADRLEGAVVRVRTTTDLGPNYRPRHMTGDGAATWVRFPDGVTALVTAYAHLAQAERVEVFVDDTWHDASVRYGTAMFDLAVLETGAPLDPATALPIAARWSLGDAVYVPTLASADPNSLARRDHRVVLGSFGAPPTGHFAFYARALFIQHNGYPVVSVAGDVLAVTSITATDAGGGVLSIPFQQVLNWRAEWEQLDTDSPIGWEPRVRTGEMDLRTGQEAFGP